MTSLLTISVVWDFRKLIVIHQGTLGRRNIICINAIDLTEVLEKMLGEFFFFGDTFDGNDIS